MHEHLAVVNAGGWGTALAVLLASAGTEVRLWCRRPSLVDELTTTRQNAAYLPGVTLPEKVVPTASLEHAVRDARAVLLVPISRAMRETVRAVAPFIAADTPLAHASKGLEVETLRRLSEVIADEVG